MKNDDSDITTNAAERPEVRLPVVGYEKGIISSDTLGGAHKMVMRLPSWFPQVGKPWNPAFQDTWDAMSPDDRRWSAAVDLVVVAIALLIIFA